MFKIVYIIGIKIEILNDYFFENKLDVKRNELTFSLNCSSKFSIMAVNVLPAKVAKVSVD